MAILPQTSTYVSEEPTKPWLDRPLTPLFPWLTIERLIIILIMAAAIFSRLYILGARVMSHDEVNHVVPSFDLFQGRGYRVDPITHGPFQFHIIALSYFMLGDNDFTSRLPSALFSIATVFFAWWGYRRYLGRTGALVASFMILISPYMLFYGRYTRNESYLGLDGLVLLYAILRYLDTGKHKYLYLLSFALVFHFIVKETAYIYTAQTLIFLALLAVYRVFQRKWRNPQYKRTFLMLLGIGILLLGAAFAVHTASQSPALQATPPNQVGAAPTPIPTSAAGQSPITLLLAGFAVLDLLAALYFLIYGASLRVIRSERSFDMLILTGTLVLPLLTAFPVKLMGWDPLDYSNAGALRTATILVPLTLVGIAVGLWWRPRLWLGAAALFYGVFVVFFTTFFTNGSGFLVGLVGSLGYWTAQQAVDRGQQPLYYYALIQIPIYEYLAALGAILAFFLALRKPWLASIPVDIPIEESSSEEHLVDEASQNAEDNPKDDGLVTEPMELTTITQPGSVYTETETETPIISAQTVPVIGLFLYWSAMSLLAYSVAGEKMPWLTVHITWPMILAAGWSIGYGLNTTPWKRLHEKKGLLALLLLPVFLFSLASAFGSLLGTQLPFQGKDLIQLQNTTTFLVAVITALASGGGLLWLMRGWSGFEVGRWVEVIILVVLVGLTARTAIRASYINYDTAKEYLVYAHAARSPKDVLNEVTDISHRLTGGLDIAVAYDDETLYPFWWYFRYFPNKVWYADKPTRDLRNDPIVIVGDKNYSKVEPILGQAYTSYEVMRLWWPNQDYFGLTWDRIKGALTNPALRAGIWQIWFNRDYTQYAQATNNTHLTLTTWDPSNKLRVYIRKDIVSQIWKYGVAPTTSEVQVDPYEKGTITLAADQTVGSAGNQPGQLTAPHAMAVAADGSIYVADSGNNRIQHFAAGGGLIQTWGTFADVSKGNAPGGTFNEPWGVAVAPDGSVYVADTWNNRIQKFSADGKFERMWGYFGSAEKPEAFWGPRGIAVNAKGQVLVTDTGNKRVVVFDANGGYVTQFGGAGAQPGQMDEPVGIGVNAAGQVFVADTWNQRIQVFTPDATGQNYTPSLQWDVSAWYGQSLENKPFLALDSQSNVFVTDPDVFRVLEFDAQGKFVRAWGDNTSGPTGFGVPSGIAADAEGNVWVSDAGNNRVMHFVMPK